MTRVSFRSLKPNVTRNEAVETFRGRGPGAFLTRLRNGALRCVADVYVPFRLYRVEIANGATAQRHWFALDAVNGMLDLRPKDRTGTRTGRAARALLAWILRCGSFRALRRAGRRAAASGRRESARVFRSLADIIAAAKLQMVEARGSP